MERKTRSGKTHAATTPPAAQAKRGRKKKSDETEINAIPPARRSTRGRNSAPVINDTAEKFEETKALTHGDILSLQGCSEDIGLKTNVEEVKHEVLQKVLPTVQDPKLLERSRDNEDSMDPMLVHMLLTVSGQKEIGEKLTSKCKEDESLDKSDTPDRVEDRLDTADNLIVQNIEKQMCEVTLEERQAQAEICGDMEFPVISTSKATEDIEMKGTPCYPSEPEEATVSVNESPAMNEVDVKQEEAISQPAADTSFDFMDIEDDAPFVRRSRRLQSIQFDPVPTRTENIGSSSIAPVENQKETTESDSLILEVYAIPQHIPELKQETKPCEIMMSVDQSDERLKRFEIIRENIYLKKSDKKVCKVNKTMKCDCTITEVEVKSGELGCQYNCINRLLYIECGQKCRCGEFCDNQQFQRFNYSECNVFDTVSKGFGIRATHDIPAETFIIEYVGEVLDNKQFEKRAKKYSENKNIHYYFMALKSNAIIDATKKGNISRFINHSCDPNAETQKWTVNGELRVGFFSRKDIKSGEEITFDYQYQRYGKEAQKCYCDAPKCRGWIGENPLDEDEEDVVESPEIDDTKAKKPKARKGRKAKAPLDKSQPEVEIKDEYDSEDAKKSLKKREDAENRQKKRQEIFEDLEIEGEINDLTESGLKTRAHTIRLSRLVVRAKNAAARSRLLKILFTGDLPCCRLFLDYNGLKLLYHWMLDLNLKSSIPDLELAIEMMKAFEILPITNKTVLRTSKVLDKVERWKNLDLEKKKMTKEERKQLKAEKKKNKGVDKPREFSDQEAAKSEAHASTEEMKENIEASQQVPDENPIDDLTALKIRVKQVASDLLEKWEELKEDFKIPKKQKQEIMIEHEREADDWEEDSNTPLDDALSTDQYKKRFGDETAQSSVNRNVQTTYRKQFNPVSKQERRQMFEIEVAQKDTEKRMRMLHDNNCQIFGLNPITTHPLDVPVRVNRVTGEYNTIDGRIAPPPPNHYQFKYEPLTLSTNPEDYLLPPIDLPEHWQFALDEYGRIYYYHEKIRQSQWEAPIKILPLKIDANNEMDSPDSDESTTDTEDSEEEELKALLDMLKRKKLLPTVHHSSATNPLVLQSGDGDDDDLEKKIMSNMMQNPVDQPLKLSQLPQKRMKKKRHGLTSMQFIRPRTEADKVYGRAESKRYKEVKEKLRQKKRRILKGEAEPGDDASEDDDVPLDESIGSRKFVDELDILELNKNKEAEKKAKKIKPVVVVDQVEARRQFRDEMIREITKFLHPFREDSCENGKITNDIDFTTLVNKLTFSVLTKETKHCQQTNSVLKATDSVKAKSKEYIKKYMGKFNGPYQRKEEEQDYAIILNKF